MIACAQSSVTDAETARALDQLYDAWALTAPGIPTIDAATLMKDLNRDTPPLLIDVRDPHERAVSILPGAISLEDYEANRARHNGRPVVTYCTVGVRSGYVARRLAKEGVNATNFRGSILAWTHAGGPLVTPTGKPTDDVHVYGKRWNYANSAYDPFVGDPPQPLP